MLFLPPSILDYCRHLILMLLFDIFLFGATKPPTPWLSSELKQRIRHRNVFFKQAKQANSLLGFAIYREYRDKLTRDLRTAKDTYRYNRLNSIVNPTKMWKELANLGLIKAKLLSPFHFFTPNQLNSHYASISTNICLISANDLPSFLTQTNSNGPTFSFFLILSEEIAAMLKSHSSFSHSSGPDNISPFCISNSLSLIVSHLTTFFNYSILFSYFPNEWKKAYIRPLAKVNPPRLLSDTRPIANLSELSKLLERIIHEQIVKFLDLNNILDPVQSTYRTGYSTQMRY